MDTKIIGSKLTDCHGGKGVICHVANKKEKMKTEVKVSAIMKVIAQKKGNVLYTEPFETSFKLMEDIAYPGAIVKELADSQIRIKYVEHFINLLKKDHSLKRDIGGTKWAVEPTSLKFIWDGVEYTP